MTSFVILRDLLADQCDHLSVISSILLLSVCDAVTGLLVWDKRKEKATFVFAV